MGYTVTFHQHLRFPKKHHEAALAALNEYHKTRYENLFELIVKAGFCEFYVNENGLSAVTDGTIVCKMDYHGKWDPSDTSLHECIAPFVEDTEITLYGEDGQSWQWVIQGGKFKRRHVEYITDDE
jgi:hypothetical protein